MKRLSFFLALLLSGCCGTTTEIVDRRVSVPVPWIKYDTVYSTTQSQGWNDTVDSLLCELEALKYPDPKTKPSTGFSLRQYFGGFKTQRGDSAQTTFNLTAHPFFSDWLVMPAPVDTTIKDTTRTVHVDEYTFFEKVGFAALFSLIGAVIAILFSLIKPKVVV